MKTVRITEEGYLLSPSFLNANIPVEVDDETYIKITICNRFKNWRLVNNEWILETLLTDDMLRLRRISECFNIIDNRSQLWWNRLTEEQKTELNDWYEKWLNITETKVIPEKPEWLK